MTNLKHLICEAMKHGQFNKVEVCPEPKCGVVYFVPEEKFFWTYYLDGDIRRQLKQRYCPKHEEKK